MPPKDYKKISNNFYFKRKIKNPFKRFILWITGKNKWKPLKIGVVDFLEEESEVIDD